MVAELDLPELYEAVFGVAPSHSSKAVMQRLQALLGLKRGDSFSRMLIVQLRSADQMEETRQQLQTLLGTLNPMLATARMLTREIEHSHGDVARRNRRIPAMERAAELVDTGRALPLFAYLACAFRRRRANDDLHAQECRMAARFDLLLCAGILLIALLIGGLLRQHITS